MSRQPAPNSIRRQILFVAAGVLLVSAVAVLVTVAVSRSNDDGVQTIGLVKVYDHISAGDVVAAEVNDNSQRVVITLDDGTTLQSSYPALGGGAVIEALRDAGVSDSEVSTPAKPSLLSRLALTLLPVLLLGALILVLLRRVGGAAAIAVGSKSTPVDVPTVRFVDVVGVPEAVDDLTEVVDVLRNPELFERAGARVPKGVLLVGPPGTGKTLLAKAVAAEAGCPFYAITGSDFVEIFAGVGPKRVRKLFETARKAGRAVIFIDEIDAVGRSRSAGPSSGATEERESTLNALLTEMDGFSSGQIVVLAATNRPELLDQALVRAGRFDRQVAVPLPDRGGRTKLFRFYLTDSERVDGFDIDATADLLARRSTGLSGADIANIVNEAKLVVAKRGDHRIDVAACEEALERIAMGRERRSAVMTDAERRIVAFHESGHTLAALMQGDVADPMQVSIVPRGAAGGVTWLDPGEQEHFVTRSALHSQLVVAMGGRAAEKLILDGDFTQGASGDIDAATRRATQMVCQYGMSELGQVAIDPDRLTGEDAATVRNVVRDIIEAAADRADVLLAEHRVLLDSIAGTLLERESLSREELRQIVAAYLVSDVSDLGDPSDAAPEHSGGDADVATTV